MNKVVVCDKEGIYDVVRRQFDVIRDLREGFISNFYVSEQAFRFLQSNGKMTLLWHSKSAALIREADDFCILYYASTSNEQLGVDLPAFLLSTTTRPIAVDLLGREKDMASLQSPFVGNGFTLYSKLMRMSRYTNTEELKQESVLYAEPSHASEILSLLHQNFDPLCEQLPFLEQIKSWIAQNRILIRVINQKVVGFIIFELIGLTSYMRYWWADPNYRNQKIGSSLMRAMFFESTQTKRQQLWVLQNNSNAIACYQHYGYTAENMLDYVLILK